MIQPPLIVHVVHRFSVGGLENGLVNLLNRLPRELARHCVLSLTRVDAAFAARVGNPDVHFIELDKAPGQTARVLPEVYRVLRRLAPALVHTRNLGTLECQIAAWFARVPARVHGEHGWDLGDLHGSNRRYARLRRLIRPLVHHQVALSARTLRYLTDDVGVAPARVTAICNGVDVSRFQPRLDSGLGGASTAIGGALPLSEAPNGWVPAETPVYVIGTVGRLSGVKNQRLLCEAFVRLRRSSAAFRRHGRLLVVGDGPDRSELERFLTAAGAGPCAWFAGERNDIPTWLRAMDVFCLPSLAEGISNSILEAMACGLPVVATDVGGNAELIQPGETGQLVPSADAEAMARVLQAYADDPDLCSRHGRTGRELAVAAFSLDGMVAKYAALYAGLLHRQPERLAQERPSCAG